VRQANCDVRHDVNDIDRLTDDKAITEILAEWRRRLRASPDVRPRQGGRGHRERALTRALLEAASARHRSPTEDVESLSKLAMIAALYGVNQPRERLDPGALCEELSHLREAVWQYLKRQHLSSEVATDRILAFDRALSVALRAALTGGYRCSEGMGELQQMLPAIVTDTVSPMRATSEDHG
jgi:predicted RNA-binding Zn ribbon-like protein